MRRSERFAALTLSRTFPGDVPVCPPLSSFFRYVPPYSDPHTIVSRDAPLSSYLHRHTHHPHNGRDQQ